ncbi:MAG: Bax inhibitor-1 family protein [Thermoguttaceae bacterium]|jgi:FtsH-binding integral membrane protein
MDYEKDYYMSDGQVSRGMSSAEATGRLVASVYTKLTLSVIALALIEFAVFALVGAETVVAYFSANVALASIVLISLCIVGPIVGNVVLSKNPSRGAQYGLLAFYILLESAILLPILAIAAMFFGTTIIWQAIGLAASLFIALSAAVFFTRTDFSFLRTGLFFVGIAALMLIVASLIFNFVLGTWFSVALILFACGYILYGTSTMLLDADESHDIILTISLFTSIVTLFFYILRLLMALNRN